LKKQNGGFENLLSYRSVFQIFSVKCDKTVSRSWIALHRHHWTTALSPVDTLKVASRK